MLEVKAMYRKEAAKTLGVHPETFTAILRSLGITHRRKLSIEEIQRVNQRCGSHFFKMTRLKLAEHLQAHPHTIATILRRYGINHQRKLSYEELEYWYRKLNERTIPDP